MPEANGPVLVVDDEADIRRLLTMNLKREGFRVLAAENGQEALRLAQADPPILVVLDLMLPDIQGTEVCRSRQLSDGLEPRSAQGDVVPREGLAAIRDDLARGGDVLAAQGPIERLDTLARRPT